MTSPALDPSRMRGSSGAIALERNRKGTKARNVWFGGWCILEFVAMAACASLALLASLLLAGCVGLAHAPAGANAGAALPAPGTAAGQLDARLLLGDLTARASRLGAGTPALVASSQAIDNGWVGGFIDVPGDACVLGYARGSSSIDDVDVAIYSEDGTTLAVDEGRDVHPTVLICAPHPDRMYLTAHIVEGEGFVAVGAQLVPKDRAVIVARALGARGYAGQGPRAAEAWPGLDDAVRHHRGELGGAWQEFRRVALAIDARMPTYAAFPLDADECVDAVIVPDDDVGPLDVEAYDDQGRVVARAREGAGTRTLTVCSPVPMAGTLAVRPHVGRGLAAVVLARTPGDASRDLAAAPDVAWVTPSLPIDKAKSARDALLAKSGYDAAVTTTSGTLSLGHRARVPLELKGIAGSCARIDVVGGAPLALLDARVWSDTGALLASAEASSALALFVCARVAAHLEIETRGRPGPFVLTVRSERWRDASFEAHPLAASRMLARAAAGPDMLLDGKEQATRELVLDGERITSWSETIAARKCLRATVGVQGDGAGVEARVFEGSDELDRSEAAHAASVRACATTEAPRAVRFEVRASAGHVDAVLGERTSSRP